jgi:hypothetical protein
MCLLLATVGSVIVPAITQPVYKALYKFGSLTTAVAALRNTITTS